MMKTVLKWQSNWKIVRGNDSEYSVWLNDIKNDQNEVHFFYIH